MLEAKVSSKGQITIPIEIRKELGVDIDDAKEQPIIAGGIREGCSSVLA